MTSSTDKSVIDPFEAALGVRDVKGRSPWEDAWHRLLKNRAAVHSAFVMAFMILLVMGIVIFYGVLIIVPGIFPGGASLDIADSQQKIPLPGSDKIVGT